MTLSQRSEAFRRADSVVEAPSGAKVRPTQLTPKEQACLRLVAKHLSSKEIAAELGIAKTSVDTYCNRARAKLGVSDRYEAARRLVSDQAPADRHFRPAVPERGSSPSAAASGLAVNQDGHAEPRRPVGVASVIMMLAAATLALATLLSGLRALDLMRPLPAATDSAARQ